MCREFAQRGTWEGWEWEKCGGQLAGGVGGESNPLGLPNSSPPSWALGKGCVVLAGGSLVVLLSSQTGGPGEQDLAMWKACVRGESSVQRGGISVKARGGLL